MGQERYRALVVDQAGAGVTAAFRDLAQDEFPPGEVTVRVAYSGLNYKDGLAVAGRPGVIRSYPMVPGIDLAGSVEESASPDYRPGDQVLVTGWGLGERHWGGYAQLARVRAEWLVRLPEGLTPARAMGLGTAGLTAMLAVLALERHGLAPGEREVAVTGAAGGVGSVAVALLARLGHTVTAVSGRAEAHDYLRALGARQVVGREAVNTGSGRPLEAERWGGAVDTVGGELLAGLLSQMARGTAVAACGNAGGMAVSTTVAPFILRGVSLLGIDSVTVPPAQRREIWRRLATDLPPAALDRIMRVAPLSEVQALAGEILAGRIRGHIALDVRA